MKIVRLYTGSDQKSHFEDIEVKFGGNQPMLTTDPRPATSAVFVARLRGSSSIAIRRRAGNTSSPFPGLGKSKRATA